MLATPVGAMADVLRRAAPRPRAGLRRDRRRQREGLLVETLPGLLPAGRAPTSARTRWRAATSAACAHARADLFEGAACVVTPRPATPAARSRACVAFWARSARASCGATPAQHDAEVAWVSHLPHALAFAFARALGRGARRAPPSSRGAGFRDFTRIAHSDPELWADILAANRKALAGPLAPRRGALARARARDRGRATPRPSNRFLGGARAKSLARSRTEMPDPGRQTGNFVAREATAQGVIVLS